jgi:hypothetical protein
MSESARRLNFLISAEVAAELAELVPPGQRSRVVTEAIRKEMARCRRKMLTDKLMILRERGPAFSTDEIVEAVKSDRKRTR